MGSVKQTSEEEMEKQLPLVPATGMFAQSETVDSEVTTPWRGERGSWAYGLKHSRVAGREHCGVGQGHSERETLSK